MQVFVLGMHRSGTSALARILNLMGLYFGGENVSTGSSPENQKGFWERRDVRTLNDTILFNACCDWDRASSLDLDALPEESKAEYRSIATDIVMNMDAHRPWFMKEPRFCILFPIWREVLETPVCIHIHRNPLEVAHSLKSRNNIPIGIGLALWELYNVRALSASVGTPRLFLSYEALMRKPLPTIESIHAELAVHGNYGLRMPDQRELVSFLDEKLYRQRESIESLRAIATNSQLALYDQLQGAASRPDTTATPILSTAALDTLRTYESSVDPIERMETANARQQRRSTANLELQLALKSLELKHALGSMRETSARSRAFERKADQLREAENNMKIRLALRGKAVEALGRDKRRLERGTADLKRSKADMQSSIYEAAQETSVRRVEVLDAVKRRDMELAYWKSKIAGLKEQSHYLAGAIDDMLHSRRWRIGSALLSLRFRLLLQRIPPTVQDSLPAVMAAHHAKRSAFRAVASAQVGLLDEFSSRVPSQTQAVSKLAQSDLNRDIELTEMLLERELEFGRRKNEIAELNEFVDSLIDIAETLTVSGRWRLGHFLLSIPRRLLLRGAPPTVADSILEFIAEHRLNILPETKQSKIPAVEPVTSIPDNRATKIDQANPQGETVEAAQLRFDAVDPVPAIFDTKVDIVVCVHNALGHVEQCLASIFARTTVEYRLIIVNDGSDAETTAWLRQLAAKRSVVELIETNGPLGYTCAANCGLRASSAENVVLLNSDTIVPRLWLEGMLECMECDAKVGIVGPLSNAASWQSIPERFDRLGGWAVNELPPGYNVDEFAELVHATSEKTFPRVDFLNGFCMIVNRDVIDRIGYLDEAAFPRGYGEENDYCLRARDAGFDLAIADQCFVYHAKSKSFGDSSRSVLAKQGGETLRGKHGSTRVHAGTERLKQSPELARIRARVNAFLNGNGTAGSDRIRGNSTHTKPNSVLYVLPVKGGSGGANSVIQEAAGLRSLGIDTKVATHIKYMDGFRRFYRELLDSGQYFIFFDSDKDLLAKAEPFDVVVATLWSTPALILPIAMRWPDKLFVYYVQDYEPWFFPNDPESRSVAFDSYTLLPDMALMAKTDWMCRTVHELHGCDVYRIAPSLDRDIYFPGPASEGANETVSIAAMIRPSTPRRAPLRTLRVLREAAANANRPLRILLFGCETRDMRSYVEKHDPDLRLDFKFDNRGLLTREKVADVLRSADIFVDLSDYQAFGRTGLEAMACGCAVVLPRRGGVHEYAVDGDNASIVDTTSFEDMTGTLNRLIEDSTMRHRMQNRGIETAARYSIVRASLSELSVFRLAWLLKRTRRTLSVAAFGLGHEPARRSSPA